MEEHPVQQPIASITVWNGNEGLVEFGAYAPEGFRVGFDGVTRIEACQKSGMHANIPYVRVWKGDVCEAEFCQHNIVGVYFDTTPQPSEADVARWKAAGIQNIDDSGKCTTCELPAAECDCMPF